MSGNGDKKVGFGGLNKNAAKQMPKTNPHNAAGVPKPKPKPKPKPQTQRRPRKR